MGMRNRADVDEAVAAYQPCRRQAREDRGGGAGAGRMERLKRRATGFRRVFQCFTGWDERRFGGRMQRLKHRETGFRRVFQCFTGAHGAGGGGRMDGLAGGRHGDLAGDRLKILSKMRGGSHGVVQSANATAAHAGERSKITR
jgi:hypothetical protein